MQIGSAHLTSQTGRPAPRKLATVCTRPSRPCLHPLFKDLHVPASSCPTPGPGRRPAVRLCLTRRRAGTGASSAARHPGRGDRPGHVRAPAGVRHPGQGCPGAGQAKREGRQGGGGEYESLPPHRSGGRRAGGHRAGTRRQRPDRSGQQRLPARVFCAAGRRLSVPGRARPGWQLWLQRPRWRRSAERGHRRDIGQRQAAAGADLEQAGAGLGRSVAGLATRAAGGARCGARSQAA